MEGLTASGTLLAMPATLNLGKSFKQVRLGELLEGKKCVLVSNTASA